MTINEFDAIAGTIIKIVMTPLILLFAYGMIGTTIVDYQMRKRRLAEKNNTPNKHVRRVK
jgi:hypothetical protein